VKNDGITERDKGLLSPQEADRLVAEYRRSAGIPVNTWEKREPSGHPPVPPILEAFGHGKGLCPLCGFPFGTGVQRVDLPVGHPHFGRLARCQACNNGR